MTPADLLQLRADQQRIITVADTTGFTVYGSDMAREHGGGALKIDNASYLVREILSRTEMLVEYVGTIEGEHQ